jgi:serine/threonine-protein kinase
MIGKTISHYRILEKLGEGGMGVVYLAEDLSLKRQVVLKFPASQAIGGDEEKARFLREARAAASLSHPNIATIHEISDHEEGMFIVMEHIDGESLEEKVKRGPLRLKDAVDIIAQAASGLKAAHEKGIVHRDIKSSNIMVTQGGRVKIMDFGLAKLAGDSKLTREGTTLGTVSYMSPEQTRGEQVDQRTDIWSIGVVLYELISGQRPFKGDYDQAVIYAILSEDPEPLTAIRTGVPMELERIVSKLLSKEPAQRYQHSDEIPVDLRAIDLSDSSSIRSTGMQRTYGKARRPAAWRTILPWTIAALAAVIAALSLTTIRRGPDRTTERWNISLPDSAPASPLRSAPLGIERPALALSPDGSVLVYVASSGSTTRLFKQSLGSFDLEPIPGTEGAYNPFFSPDGLWIGFFRGNELMRISITGRSPVSICPVTNSYGACWTTDNRIIFSQNEGDHLCVVPASGGDPEIISSTKGSFTWPSMLPGGKMVVLSDGRSLIKTVSIETGEEKTILKRGMNPVYMPGGYLLFVLESSLCAVSFDPARLEVTGSIVPVIEMIRIGKGSRGSGQYAISRNGSIAYLPGRTGVKSHLVWLDRDGGSEKLGFPPERYGTFQLSPDDKRLAVQIVQGLKSNVWIYELDRETRARLTFNGYNSQPIWSPDGERITFSSSRRGKREIYEKAADFTGAAACLAAAEYPIIPYTWSPDGRTLVFSGHVPTGDLFYLSAEKSSEFNSLTTTDFNEWGAAFSPDGKFVAYVSDEQGRYDVYVETVPKSDRRWRISPEGGEEPVWSRSSNELFYRNGREWMSVRYAADPAFSAELPETVFDGDYVNVPGRSYDVSRDGRRFLLIQDIEERLDHTSINVITNWCDELEDRMKPAD